jgi:PEP-CTERM motif-containing protein
MLSVVRDRCAFHRRKIVALSCVLAAWLASAAPASAAAISIVPSQTTVTQGQTFTLDFQVTGAIDLYEIQFSVKFDTNFFSLVDPTPADDTNIVSQGTFLSDSGAVATDFRSSFESQLGAILIAAISLNDIADEEGHLGVSGNGSLFSVTFLANAAVTGESLVLAFFDPVQSDGLYDSTFINNLITYGDPTEEGGFPPPVQFESRVTVQAPPPPPMNVPEPGTLLLLSTGLASTVIATCRRRRRLRD